MKKIKRLFIYLTCIILIISMMAFNVGASGYEGTVIDLLTASNYALRLSTTSWYSVSYPGGNSGNYSNIHLKWDNSFKSKLIKTIYINIRSSADISTVRLGTDDQSTPPLATYCGMYDGLYQFKLENIDYTFSLFSLRIFFGSSTNVEFLVESVYGIVNDAIPVSGLNHNTYLVDFSHNTSGQGTLPTINWYEGGPITLPYTISIQREVYPITGIEWAYQQNMVELYFASQNLKDIGKVSILIFSNDINAATVSLNVGGVKDVIPSSLNAMLVPQKWPSFVTGINYWQMCWYELTFDLSNYDLSGSNSCAYIYFEGEPDTSQTGYMYTYNEIIGAWYYPVDIETPWYQTMWNWISSGFDRVVNALTANDSSSIQQSAEEMQSQANDMNAANEVLNNVNRPTIDTVDLLQNTLDFSPTSLSVLSAFTSNPTISGMLLLVFTFALIGYIFFGKKG